MKPPVFLASVLIGSLAAPAFADNGQVFDYAAQLRAYSSARPLMQQCFDGRVSGANRLGATTLLVQSRTGPIFSVDLAEACPGLDAAKSIAVRPVRGDVVCRGEAAELVLGTADGVKRCRVDGVQALTRQQAASLSTAQR